MTEIAIGDAVVSKDAPDGDVMTVYDLTAGYSVARCNWVVGTRMFRMDFPVSKLRQVERSRRRNRQ